MRNIITTPFLLFLIIFFSVVFFEKEALFAQDASFGSCSFQAKDVCFEFKGGYTFSKAEKSCSNVQGVYSKGNCAVDLSVGRCFVSSKNSSFEELNIIFYKNTYQLNNAKKMCMEKGGLFF